MGTRVQLVNQDNLYSVLTYLNSGENPTFKTCFPYTNENQEKALAKAREFGQGMAKSLGVSLEENLNNIA